MGIRGLLNGFIFRSRAIGGLRFAGELAECRNRREWINGGRTKKEERGGTGREEEEVQDLIGRPKRG